MKNKKQIIIYVIIAIVFFFIGGTVGSRAEYNRLTKVPVESSSNKDNSNNSSSDNSTSKEEEPKIISLNQSGNIGNVEMKVLNVKETEKISNEAGTSSSSGKFVVIELSLKNNDKQPIEYDTHQFQLISNDIVYQIDDVAFNAAQDLNQQKTIFDKNKDYIGVYDKFNAGLTKKTYLVFDVPKDIKLDTTKLIIENNKNVQFALNK